MLSRCFLDCSVGVGVFVTGLSQIQCSRNFLRNYWTFGPVMIILLLDRTIYYWTEQYIASELNFQCISFEKLFLQSIILDFVFLKLL